MEFDNMTTSYVQHTDTNHIVEHVLAIFQTLKMNGYHVTALPRSPVTLVFWAPALLSTLLCRALPGPALPCSAFRMFLSTLLRSALLCSSLLRTPLYSARRYITLLRSALHYAALL
jgi:hypothetical protein